MPELSNIQTYVLTDELNFRNSLNKFKKVLRKLSLWNEELESKFLQFDWIEEENGFVYSSLITLDYQQLDCFEYSIRPLAMIVPGKESKWFSFNFLTPSYELRAFYSGSKEIHYRNDVLGLVKKLAHALHDEFNETGIYFADEAQDGVDLKGLTRKDYSKLWNFDFAIIPNTLKDIYSEVPSTHRIIEYPSYFEAYYFEKWPALNI